jgi:hypothetical protein
MKKTYDRQLTAWKEREEKRSKNSSLQEPKHFRPRQKKDLSTLI